MTVLLVFTRIAGVAGMEMRKSHILLALGASMRQACGAKSCLVSPQDLKSPTTDTGENLFFII